MKVEIDCPFLTMEEVFNQLKPAIEQLILGENDWLANDCEFNWSTATEEIILEVTHFENDPRIDGKRNEYVDLSFIRENCNQYAAYHWAKDELGQPVLLCLD